MNLRFLTSGESHGRGFLITIEGFPAQMDLPMEALQSELKRRRRGFGRGARMRVEEDRLSLWGGVRDGRTTGAPIGIVLENSEWASWEAIMDPVSIDPQAAREKGFFCPRPGHADLSGAMKYGHHDLRDVLERASARLTASWTLAGTVARLLLEALGVFVYGAVTSIGGISFQSPGTLEEWEKSRWSDMGCMNAADEAAAIDRIRTAFDEKETLGGAFMVCLKGLPPGVGSYVEWDRRLDGRFAAALMAIPGIKGVEIGEGFRLAGLLGSQAHDEIGLQDGAFVRFSNRAGGIEGGMTNGEDVLLTAVMKPIPTLKKPLRSVDLSSGLPTFAHFERSDVCAVPAACVVAEAMACWVAAEALMEQLGGDVLQEVCERMEAYRRRVVRYGTGFPE